MGFVEINVFWLKEIIIYTGFVGGIFVIMIFRLKDN